jgi:predicted RNA binding protein YcfA (HicA-like mRNA interferase family)
MGVPPLPIISAEECIRALGAFGYTVTRQKGSHVRLMSVGRMPVTVPMHKGKELKRGTLRSILRDADVTVEQFLAALRG